MAEITRMPKMSDTMTQGIIAAWHKKVNDVIKSGELLAEIETDKATMELEADTSGTLLYIGPKVGEAVPINDIIAIIGQPGEDINALLEKKITPTPTETSVNHPSKTESIQSTLSTTASPTLSNTTKRIFASPLAKKIAQEANYNLADIAGTGDGGRIVKRDVEQLLQTKTDHPPILRTPQQENYHILPASSMRKTIAKRLTESTNQIPHFYLQITVNMDKLVEFRSKTLTNHTPRISYNDIIIKATAHALGNHPQINTTWLGDSIRYNQHIHIGVAMALSNGNGLVVPIVRFADQLSLSEIALTVQDLQQKANHNQLQPADWEGLTFTLSNLGMLGIEAFTAIINPPAACILAVGAIQTKPIVKEGVVVPASVMKMTLSCDHRVVDGAVGAAFLATLKDLLESPLKLLI